MLDRYLPPKALWPQRLYTLPEHQSYPDRLNSTEELIDRHVAEGRGDRVALYFEDQRITYRQLQASIDKLGSALRELGIGEEDRVLLRAPSIPPALVANFAIIKIGAIVVPTSPLFSRAEIVHIAQSTDAVALIVAAPMLEEVATARAELTTVRHVIVIGGDAAEIKAKGYLPWGELLARGSERLEPVRRARMAVSVLLFTSGTTGMPKGTVHFMEEALIVPDGFGKYGWGVTPDDVVGGPAPLSLAAGYSTQAVIPFRFGAAASLLPRFTPEGMFEQIQKHRITVVSILPTAYRKMMQVPDAASRNDLSSVRVCTGGGDLSRLEANVRSGELRGVRNDGDDVRVHLVRRHAAGEAGRDRAGGPWLRASRDHRGRQGGEARRGRTPHRARSHGHRVLGGRRAPAGRGGRRLVPGR